MFIKVFCGGNKIVTLNLNRGIKLSVFKNYVHRITRIPIDEFSISHEGSILNNDEDLRHCKMHTGSTFTLELTGNSALDFLRYGGIGDIPEELKARAEKLSGSALTALVDPDCQFAWFPIADPLEDLKTVDEDLPFVCLWRLSALWKLIPGVKIPFIVIQQWPVSMSGSFILSHLVLLKIVNFRFEVVSVVGCSFDLSTGLVIEAKDASDICSGGYFSVACRHEGLTCSICHGNDDNTLIACNHCKEIFHMKCVSPPLLTMPKSTWLCQKCLMEVRDGNNPTVVGPPAVVFGPIPGVPVGTSWEWLFRCGKSGVHCVNDDIHVTKDGCVSICLTGVKNDVIDDGDEILIVGNKIANQANSFADQKVVQGLMKNCLCHKGCSECTASHGCGECRSKWRDGKPIRLCRSSALRSKYSPVEGIRYDGIYKLVDYWQQDEMDGETVWRFLLRRDDSEPVPWTVKEPENRCEKPIDSGAELLNTVSQTRQQIVTVVEEGTVFGADRELSDKESTVMDVDDDDIDNDYYLGDVVNEGTELDSSFKPFDRSQHDGGSDADADDDDDESYSDFSDADDSDADDLDNDVAAADSEGKGDVVTGKNSDLLLYPFGSDDEIRKIAEPERKKVEGDDTDVMTRKNWRTSALDFLGSLMVTATERLFVDRLNRIVESSRTEERFLESLRRELTCPECEEESVNPSVILECGHNICCDCYQRLLSEDNLRCKLCDRCFVKSIDEQYDISPNQRYEAIADYFFPERFGES